VIIARDPIILMYLYEKYADRLHTDEADVILLLRMCIALKWSEGFMMILNSYMTEKIFTHSTKEFKAEFI
jgi:hypothetical protein